MTRAGSLSRAIRIAAGAALALVLLAAAPAGAHAAIALTHVETQAAPGTAVSTVAFNETSLGVATTSADAYAAVVSQTNPQRTWDVYVSVTSPLTHTTTGASIPSSDLLVESASLTGVYQDLSVERAVQTALSNKTTTSGYFHLRFAPDASRDSGSYSGQLQVRVATATESSTMTLNLAASVTGAIAIAKLTDTTGVPAVTSTSFPETAPGTTSASIGPYVVALSSTTGRWSVQVAITTAFAKATGDTLPGSAILVSGPAQAGSYVDLSTARVVESSIPRSTLSSGPVTFKLAPAAGQDSGLYTGVVTFTVSTL